MIKKVQYQCEYCGFMHNTAEDAKRCEKWHKGIDHIESSSYEPSDQYPKTIGVRFEDGEYLVYGRQR